MLLNRLDPLPKWYAATVRRIDRQNTRAARLILVNYASCSSRWGKFTMWLRRFAIWAWIRTGFSHFLLLESRL
ncbi:MAG: hypothetical protein H6662_19545 [Ardenticatenaceae bacterium]|nr:hypothetical protein [Ardenticatenaceae bacterium]